MFSLCQKLKPSNAHGDVEEMDEKNITNQFKKMHEAMLIDFYKNNSIIL